MLLEKFWMKRIFFFISILLINFNVLSQSRDSTIVRPEDKDIIDLITNKIKIKEKAHNPKRGRVYYSVVPSPSSNIGAKTMIVSAINAAFYVGDPKKTYISSIYFVPYTDLGRQYGFMTTFNLWSDKNLWNSPGEFKIQKLSPYSFGLGSRSSNNQRFIVDYDYIRFYGSANRKIRNYLYAGLGLNYDRHFNVGANVDFRPNVFTDYGVGTGSSSASLGVTFNFLYDNRFNSINPDKGFYSTIVYRLNPGALSNTEIWGSFYFDARRYFSLPTARRNIIATWFFYWGAFGKVPYLNLPGTSMEYNARSGRGYSYGRFRGKQMLYLEGEYRFTISQNGLLGGVVFANFQSLTEPFSERFDAVNPGAGFGARIKFNKSSNTNLDLDFGFGKDSFNVYVNLGELF